MCRKEYQLPPSDSTCTLNNFLLRWIFILLLTRRYDCLNMVASPGPLIPFVAKLDIITKIKTSALMKKSMQIKMIW